MNTYTISQVAEQLSLKVHTIRYWEKHVPMLSNVGRDEHGTRLYTRQDVYLLLRMRHYIEERHFTVKGAADELMSEMSNSTEGTFTQRKEIMLILKKLEIQKERLNSARELLRKDMPDDVTNDEDTGDNEVHGEIGVVPKKDVPKDMPKDMPDDVTKDEDTRDNEVHGEIGVVPKKDVPKDMPEDVTKDEDQ